MRTFEINLGELHLTRLAYQKQIEKLTQHKEKLLSLAAKLSTMWEGKVATQFIQNMQIFLAVEYNNLLDDYREIAKKLEEAEELFVPLLSLCEGFPDIIKHGNSIRYTISGAAPSPDDILSLDEASGLEINEGIQEYSRQLTKINTLWNQAYSSSSGLSRSSFRLSNYEATFAEGTQRQGKAVSDFFDAFSFNYVPALKEADEKVANSLTNLFETVYYTAINRQNIDIDGIKKSFLPLEIQAVLTIGQEILLLQEVEKILPYLSEEIIEKIKKAEELTPEEKVIFEKLPLSEKLIDFDKIMDSVFTKDQLQKIKFLGSVTLPRCTIEERRAILRHLERNNGIISNEDLQKLTGAELDANMVQKEYELITQWGGSFAEYSVAYDMAIIGNAISTFSFMVGSYVDYKLTIENGKPVNTGEVLVVGKPFDTNGDKIQIGVDPNSLTPSKDLSTLDAVRQKNAVEYGGDHVIIVDKNGVIQDGHHRLKDAIENGRAVDIQVGY